MSEISERIARERSEASELAAKLSAFAETHRDLDDVTAAEPGALTGTAEQIEDVNVPRSGGHPCYGFRAKRGVSDGATQ
ncbi:MAG: hypothetical protein AAGM38_18305, partial [Pseudomonadota bacterium]